MTTKTPATSPTEIYLAGLSQGSQQGMRQSLEIIVGILSDDHDAESFPWWEVTYRESMAVRIALTERYKPATVNKMLSALRGVLKQTWRLGLMDADAYHRAAAVENVRGSRLLSGRALANDEIGKLFETCADDSPKGARDAALLAVLYGCGLRRGELAGLDVEDFDLDDCSIMVHGKRDTVYLAGNGCQNGDLCQDPEMVVRIFAPTDKGPGMVEALMFQQAIPPIYTLVYPEPGKVAPKAKKDLNDFLSFWLRNLEEQGHRLDDD